MTRLEYEKTINKIYEDNIIREIFNKGLVKEIKFSGTYYAIVKGKIPLLVAHILFERYPDNEYGIRINGGSYDLIPIENATDDIYENTPKSNYIPKNVDLKGYKYYIKKEKEKIKERPDKNKYIKMYHIDTKEGLVLLLEELKKYIITKTKLPQTYQYNLDDIMSEINNEILKEIDPTMSPNEWMQEDEEHSLEYFSSLNNQLKSPFLKQLRVLIEQFDSYVNPFIDGIFLVSDELKEYKDIEINASNSVIDGKKCINLKICDKKNNIDLCYYRGRDGFSFQLHNYSEQKRNFDVLHYYSIYQWSGEIIAINVFDNKKDYIDLIYNITKSEAGETYGPKHQVTLYELELIYSYLKKAILYASEVTMKKDERVKAKKL